MSEATRILEAAGRGDPRAADELLPLVYQELRQLAAHKMARENPGHTLQPTALVHEAWLRLTGDENKGWDGRAHFFGAAAEAMRRILIENARRKAALRHGGGQQRVELTDLEFTTPDDDQLLAVNEALEKFAVENKLKAELVKLRYFTGLTLGEAAELLGISEPTAKRYWAYARAWLFHEIKAAQKPPPGL
ncbi:MAG TPA: sigma-70 family RNA polymerase sigma factor [Candidatus Acidoferrales bacterium]|jgi:RNA polymerase sigma factor (TIGR02999 family)|nr:sigma-70 family RNA polymerase sigma factor [Candidatus Acidoferrales bacterium]